MEYVVRPATIKDELTVWEMLRYASHQPSVESVREQPLLARYADNWGRHGDFGYIAEENGIPVGMAWLRLWQGKDKGFGYVKDDTPELAIALIPDYRGQGIGTHLLKQILLLATDYFPAVSLSVRTDNPVLKLYKRSGFVRVPGSETVNHAGGRSFNMIRKLN